MEAAEETLTYRDDTGLHRKLLPAEKEKDGKGRAETESDESNYVDMDTRPEVAKTVKVTFTGEGNQLSVSKSDGARQGERDCAGGVVSLDSAGERSGDARVEGLPELPGAGGDAENEARRQAEVEASDGSEPAGSDSDELQYTDMYLNSKTESDDGASAVLSDHCGSDTVEDESHYITTHEIQLTELDHDVDYDLGRGTCWDFEDDNLVYSFVDYASFESDDTQEGTLIVEGRSQAAAAAAQQQHQQQQQSDLGGAVVSTEQEESDLCDSDKCASSDESVCKNQGEDASLGKIRVSIKTSSRALNEPVNSFDSGAREYAGHFGDRSHFSFVSSGARAGPLCDRAQYFIPAPGRQHLATKLRRKDINEYSSGASSSISELDDADKEVRNLTAKSFRSLACPYFDAINLSTSSESSMSEYGLNKWSAYVDWNYGNISRGRERSVIAHKTSSATLEMSKSVDNKRHGRSVAGTKGQQTKAAAPNKRTASQHASSSGKKGEAKEPVHPKQRGVTLNFRCNVEAPAGARRPKCSKNPRPSEATGTVLTRAGCEVQHHHSEAMGETQKRAIFASSLLKNVISKKMQFEQERKMERGEIRDTYPAHSPSCQLRDPDRGVGRSLQRQISESGSALTANSADDQPLEGSRPGSCEPAEEQRSSKTPDDSEVGRQEQSERLERPTAQLGHSRSSAFTSWRDDEPEPGKEAEVPSALGDTQAATETPAKAELDTSSMLTKLLFVPSCQHFSKEKEVSDWSRHAAVAPAAGPQKCETVFKTGDGGNIVGKEENDKGGKTPEIKICLRSVKENKGCTLNIANLLTPKISCNTVNTFRAAGDAKCHILSASDKIPNFTVRDIRDTKCKFQTPIYHVRDVRKLVKSSYRFVALDNSEAKCSGAPSAAADKPDEAAKSGPEKRLLPSPIVIKCQSVKTNVKPQAHEASRKQTEADAPSEAPQSEHTPTHGAVSRGPPVAAKQPNPGQAGTQTNAEKLLKQRQDKFPGETADRRPEPKIPKQAALEKIKAAVKTMEQLYVFDKNEWKRKAQAPRPITGSHVLSLIASEEQAADELETARPTDPEADRGRARQPPGNATETGKPPDVHGPLNVIHVPYGGDAFHAQSQPGRTFSNKSVLHFGGGGGGGGKACVSISSIANPFPRSSAQHTSATLRSSKRPEAPLSVKIEPSEHGQAAQQGKLKLSPTHPAATPGGADAENYLTMPGLGCTGEIQLLNREPVSKEESSNANQTHTGDSGSSEQERLGAEHPPSSIYHHPAASQTQQVLRFSPCVTTVSPTPSTGDAALQTQRKMLLDPTTGHYYLVDTPVQATTRRLFDPATGQFVDVPMPHSPVAPITPVTPIAPVPLSLSPLAMSPGAYAPTYMIYPGFIPSPTLQAQALRPPSSCHSEDAGGGKVKKGRSPGRETDAVGAEGVYYSATREAQLPASAGQRGKPIISITTQQGPRIIAPPSFDGTTMSFVVEHR